MGTLLHDIRYAVRSFRHRPGFALAVVALVALGVGATTTIFSVVDNVLFKRLSYPESEQLVFFDNPAHSVPLFLDWRDRTDSFSMIAGNWSDGFDLTGDGPPETIDGDRVTEGFFPMLGGRPALGRMFTADDFIGTPARVVLISYALWQRRWGGDAGIIGRAITLNGQPREIVGVVDPSFARPVESSAELWLPLDVTAAQLQRRGFLVLSVIAHLRSGVTLDAAQADVDRLSLALADQYPESHRRRDGSPRMYRVVSLMQATVGDIGNALYMVLGAVGLMLLIACANVANLFLARGTDRRREIALRAALGARRGRILAQLLTESVSLAVVGGALGVWLAMFGVRAFELYSPGGIPRAEGIGIDLRVLGFALLLSVATGVLFGIAPAVHAARSDIREAVGKAVPVGVGGRKAFTLRNGLVVAEIAMALMLLVGAGLLFRSFVTLRSVDIGFTTDDVLVLPLEFRDRIAADQRVAFMDELLDRIAAIPGVETVGAGSTVPPTGRYMCCSLGQLRRDGEAEAGDRSWAISHPISRRYFEALGARILRGRGFSDADDDSTLGSVIINESAASYLFGQADPLGQSFWYRDIRLNVVGVVNDIRHWRLSREGDLNIYVPFAAYGEEAGRMQVAVKSAGVPGSLAASLRDAVWSIDPDLPIGDIISLKDKVGRSIAQPRFLSILLSTFAGLAALLAAAGIYGSMLYSVGQRRKEMGIRMALGAEKANVVGAVVKRGLALTVIGLTLGIGGALALSRVLESFLFGVTPADRMTFVAVPLLLGAVALAACYLPARKAAAADPIETLRVE